MAKNWVLVAADDGRIGPGSTVRASSFETYDEAVAEMAWHINENGGGEYNEDFGNGYSEDPFVAYEILRIQ